MGYVVNCVCTYVTEWACVCDFWVYPLSARQKGVVMYPDTLTAVEITDWYECINRPNK